MGRFQSPKKSQLIQALSTNDRWPRQSPRKEDIRDSLTSDKCLDIYLAARLNNCHFQHADKLNHRLLRLMTRLVLIVISLFLNGEM